jgi:hypothetical protein
MGTRAGLEVLEKRKFSCGSRDERIKFLGKILLCAVLLKEEES